MIPLKIDEIESIRLMDLENLDQQTCADQMGIGRSTLQRIYKEARRKLADGIINGKRIIIENEVMHKGNCHGRGQGNGHK